MAKIEKRIDLPGSERTLLPGSRKIGPCEPQEQIRVTVFLRRGSSPKQFPDLEKPASCRPRNAAIFPARNSPPATARVRRTSKKFAPLRRRIA